MSRTLRMTRALTCAVGFATLVSCSDPSPPPTNTVVVNEIEDCPASAEWLPFTPPLDLFKPAAHPETECPFYRGVWQTFLIAMQPIDAAGTPALATYPTIATIFTPKTPYPANRAYLGLVKQAGGRQLAIDQNGRTLYYAIHANQAYADFIAANGLQTSAAIQKYPMNSPNLFFPAGVAEFKSAWQVYDPANPPADISTFITMKTTIPTLNQDSTTGEITEDDDTPIPASVRLLAIHVVYSYPGHPELIWGSLEHTNVDVMMGESDTKAADGHRDVAPIVSDGMGHAFNPTAADPTNSMVTAAASNQDFILYKGGTAVNQSNAAYTDNQLVLNTTTQTFTQKDGTTAQTSVYRMYPASKSTDTDPDGAITSLNSNVQELFRNTALDPTDKRPYYRLIGGQWMDKPAYFTVGSDLQNDVTSPMVTGPHIAEDGSMVGAIPQMPFLKAIATDGSDDPYSILAGEDRMSSTAMETFSQEPIGFFNCFQCHNTEAVTSAGAPYTSPTFLGAKGLNGPGVVRLLSPGLLNVSHILTEFLRDDCKTLIADPDGTNGTMYADCSQPNP